MRAAWLRRPLIGSPGLQPVRWRQGVLCDRIPGKPDNKENGLAMSPAAFVERLRSQYDGALRRLLSTFLEPDDAAELANECYAKMLALKEPQLVREPRAFLLRTARNLALDRKRRLRVEVRSDLTPVEPDEFPSLSPGPDAWLDAERLLRDMELALCDMPPFTAQIFRMRRLEGLSSSQIAADLGVTTRTVQKHLVTALVRLEAQLGHHLSDGSGC